MEGKGGFRLPERGVVSKGVLSTGEVMGGFCLWREVWRANAQESCSHWRIFISNVQEPPPKATYKLPSIDLSRSIGQLVHGDQSVSSWRQVKMRCRPFTSCGQNNSVPNHAGSRKKEGIPGKSFHQPVLCNEGQPPLSNLRVCDLHDIL
jgi:hypothetical protein